MRVAVGQLCCESNSFVAFTCDLQTVRSTGYLSEGAEVFELRDTETEVAGAIEALEAEGSEIIPLIAAHWNSSSIVEAQTYQYLKEHLFDRLRSAGRVDGVLLALHGSMVCEGEDDPTGDLCAGVRQIVGPNVPVAVTLDMHANVTSLIARSVEAIVGYRTYPHADTRETGYRGASLVARAARGDIAPHVSFVRIPMLVGSFNTETSANLPFARLVQQAREVESRPDVLAATIFLVTPYIDVPDMGCSVVVTVDGPGPLADNVAAGLARDYWGIRHALLAPTVSVDQALREGEGIRGGPILLLDSADCAGGGAAGDSIEVVRQLLIHDVQEPTLATVVDPAAATACHNAGPGANLDLIVGHHVDPRWGQPLALRGEITLLSDGLFRYNAGMFGGTQGSMGPSAVVRIGSIQLLIQSRSTYDWADEQYQSVALNPSDYKWVVVKNMMNFRQGYAGNMKGYFLLDCPGPTPPDRRALPGIRAKRPWFPMDEHLDPGPFLAVR